MVFRRSPFTNENRNTSESATDRRMRIKTPLSSASLPRLVLFNALIEHSVKMLHLFKFVLAALLVAGGESPIPASNDATVY